MNIFITTSDSWLIQGVIHSIRKLDESIKVTTIDSIYPLFNEMAGSYSSSSILLVVFPDNQPITNLRSLSFLNELLLVKKSGIINLRITCILWGRPPFKKNIDCPVIPWRISPEKLGEQLNNNVTYGNVRTIGNGNVKKNRKINLSPREIMVLQYTLEGRSLNWIAQHLGVTPKTVSTHRRRAMNSLGVKHTHELVRVSTDLLCMQS